MTVMTVVLAAIIIYQRLPICQAVSWVLTNIITSHPHCSLARQLSRQLKKEKRSRVF